METMESADSSGSGWEYLPGAQEDVVELTRALIRIDSSNWGDSPQTVGEAEVAEYCADALREAGWAPEVISTSSDSRRAVALRIPGTDPTAPALLLHGHIDVVPAMAADWSHPPFAAEVEDGFIWGRGAVDMKDMDAMILAVVRGWGRSGIRPRARSFPVPAGRGSGQYSWLALAGRQPPRPVRGRDRGCRRGGRLLDHRARRSAPVSDPDGREGHPLDPAAGSGPGRAWIDDP